MTGQQNQFHNYSLISIHFAWGPNVYSKPESNLITGPSIKTRQETAQCLDFLYLNLKTTNRMVYKGRTLYFLWTHFHAERVLHFPGRTTGDYYCSFISVHRSSWGGRTASQLWRGEAGHDCWASCPQEVHSPFPCPQELKRRGFHTQLSPPKASWQSPGQLCRFLSRMDQKSCTQDPSSNSALL